VLLDAVVVRGFLVPETMVLLGRSNWWLPAALDRVLPHLDLEGPLERSSESELQEARWALPPDVPPSPGRSAREPSGAPWLPWTT
jgi:hypothetical protein